MSCEFHLERDVNQILWYSVFGDAHPYGVDGNSFENEVFEVRPYDWSEENNDYHFYHKPSGLKIYWYKYPLRSPMSNMEITHEQFLTVLRDCFNSLKTNVSYQIDPWWTNKDVETDETSLLKSKDIKKLLSYCSKGREGCHKCDYQPTENRKGTVGCMCELISDIIPLINHYEKEIKRLESLLSVVVKSKNDYADQLEQAIKDLKTEDSIRIEQILDKVRYICGVENRNDKQVYVITKDELNMLERRLKGED